MHIFIETEHGIAATDQTLQQNIMLQKYHKQKQIANADYQQFDMTMDHIMSAFSLLPKQQYIKTHDTACSQHFKVCKEIGVKLPMNTGISLYQN